MDVKSMVESAAVTITTSTDNQGIYDKIKDFLSEYNSLINSMTSSFLLGEFPGIQAPHIASFCMTQSSFESIILCCFGKCSNRGLSDFLR